MARPPHDEAPPGYTYVVAPEGPELRFEVLAKGEAPKPCRCLMSDGPRGKRRACGAPSVAKMNRKKTSYTGGSVGQSSDSWWHYCAEHLYGRWIEDGKLVHWRMIPVEEV